MTRAIKERWIEALTSGRYEQGFGQLCEVGEDGERRYCCLGVLADIIDGGRWAGATSVWWDGHCSQISTDLWESFGCHPDAQQKLAQMNDTEFVAFSGIAKWIEENL